MLTQKGPYHRPHLKTLITAIIAVCAIISILPTINAKYTQETHYIEHTVRHNDTLYSIAREHRPNDDWRDVDDEIRRDNGITPLIHAGEVIKVRVK